MAERKNSGAAAKKKAADKAAKEKAREEDESTFVRMSVGGVECSIDWTRLTLGEVAEAERVSGQHIALLNFGSGTGQYVLAYLARRRVDPSFTSRDAYKLELDEVFEIDEKGNQIKRDPQTGEPIEPDPTDGDDETRETSGDPDSQSSE